MSDIISLSQKAALIRNKYRRNETINAARDELHGQGFGKERKDGLF